MTTQPEALRLADQLDIFNANCPVGHGFESDDAKAAAELRRQHARIAELEAALRPFVGLLQDHNDKGPDSRPIFAINEALLTLGHLRSARAALKDAP